MAGVTQRLVSEGPARGSTVSGEGRTAPPFSRAGRLLACLGLLVACLAVGSACSAGAKLRAQANQIQKLNKKIHDRAYRCAPKEIAIAESEVAFGLHELSQGDHKRAQEHIYRAEEYSKLADEFSDYKVCRPKNVSGEVGAAKAVDVKEGTNDKDGDGIVDKKDECPLEPEDFDGFQDKDGCPDADNDQDGIEDEPDACPNIAEGEPDGFQDDDGCPDPDNDSDGIVDAEDNCPGGAEDYDGYEDANGCTDQDNDGDGIADTLDSCPRESEDYDGDVDEDGCPEERERVTMTKDRIKLDEKVHFAYDKAKIDPTSYPLLNEVAKVLKANPEIELRVEGHTDSRGSASYNKKLSQRRAKAVVDYLVDQGIDRSRLKGKGFGEAKPIRSNRTKAGRAANRRVEMHIVER